MKSIKIIRKLSEGYLKKTYGYDPFRDRFDDLKKIIKKENPIIIDVGANIGETIEFFLKRFSQPHIVAFEPVTECYKILINKFGCYQNVFLNNCAVGDQEGIVKFNVANSLACSSIYLPTEETKNYHMNEINISNTIDVKINKLVNYINEFPEIDILKIDVQCYELSVLKSAGEALEKIKMISLEVEFIPLYGNQPLFSDIDIFLRKKGFIIYNLYGGYRRKNGQIECADVTYYNPKYINLQ